MDYVYGDPAMLVLPPEKKLDFPEPEISFKLTKDAYDATLKAAQVLSLPELVVQGDGSKTFLVGLISFAVSAMKWTPHITIISAFVFAASTAKASESAEKSDIP